MRVHKFLLVTTAITFLCLLYVWQQTEIFRLAYDGQKNLVALRDFLDRNNSLRYNIEKDGSLVRIGDKVFQTQDFNLPETYRLVRVAPVPGSPNTRLEATHQEGVVARLFGIKREAQAKTIEGQD